MTQQLKSERPLPICQFPLLSISPKLLTSLLFTSPSGVSLCINKPIQMIIFSLFTQKAYFTNCPFFTLTILQIFLYQYIENILFFKWLHSISLYRCSFIISPAMDICFYSFTCTNNTEMN